jgi:predicted nuclease of predicted toxin-antitoxin system
VKIKSISLETKYQVIQLIDKNVSNKQILEQFKSELND